MTTERLSISERILLAQRLWDSVRGHDDDIELTAGQRELLDQRLAAYEADSERGDQWSIVRERIRSAQ